MKANPRRPLRTITVTDAVICFARAEEADPTRGPAWDEAFEAAARRLGYAVPVPRSREQTPTPGDP